LIWFTPKTGKLLKQKARVKGARKKRRSKMKDFNLKDALAGKPVITRLGRPVEILWYSEERNVLVGLINGSAYVFTGGGRANLYTHHDLFMAPSERKEWVVIYTNTKGHRLSSLEFSYEMALHVKSKAIENGYKNVSIHEIKIHE